MYIKKLILENFEFLQVALNRNRIEVDFSTMENKICLLVGPNGCGKTSIMSLLTPFATVGNLDIRDGDGLITDGEKGYKKIIIVHNDNEYVIEHFYTPVKGKSHSVKSYIFKNGDDLNPNGNVTSFKEIVSSELHVELDYLKLVRIGSNVTSLINLSETERKTFMSKLLEEIGVFLSLHKKVSNDYKQINDLIKITQNKLNKLTITSEEDGLSSLGLFKSKLKDLQDLSDELVGKKSVAEHELSNLHDTDDLKSRISLLKKKVDKMTKIFESKNNLESTDPDFYNNKILEVEKDISARESMIESYRLSLNNLITERDRLESDLHDINISIDKEIANDEELQKMKLEAIDLEKKISDINDCIGDSRYDITEHELSSFIVFLKNIDQVVTTSYTFGKRPIRMIVTLLREGKSVNTFIQTHAFNGDDEDTISIIFNRINQVMPDFKLYEEKLKESHCSGCVLKSFYNSIYSMVKIDRDESTKLTSEEIKYMELAWSNIQRVLLSFASYKDIINKLPKYIKDKFTTEYILSCIYDLKSIYNEKEFYDLLSVVKELENKQDLESRLERLNSDIRRFSMFSNLSSLQDKLYAITNQIEENKRNRTIVKNEMSSNQDTICDLKRDLESLYDYYETFTSYQNIVSELREISDKYETYLKNTEIVRLTSLELTKIKIEIDNILTKIQSINSELSLLSSYKKELKKYKRVFDDLSVLKRALSSKEGISLKYMLRYIGNTEEVTNSLLDIAYDGKIYIDKFNISKDSFTIPFYNRGKLISDVKYASQGELSFLSIALSFALASQTLKRYNIMLLDEIDGPLDTSNREKFIRILENQIDRVDCEHCFLITHNEMFSSYPVDIIDLSFGKYSKEKYPNAHIIDVKVN